MIELTMKEYVLMFLKGEPYKHKIPGIHFWVTTGLIVRAGIKIKADNGHYLTLEDCFNEMNDCLEGDCFKNGWAESWWKQYRVMFGGYKE